MSIDTSDDRVDAVIEWLNEGIAGGHAESIAELLHALRAERNMLAYEKGGHQLWKRFAGK